MYRVTDFAKSLGLFFSQYMLQERGLAELTVESYRSTFAMFLAYCKSTHGLEPVDFQLKNYTSTLILEYLNWIETVNNCSANTRNQRLAAFKSYAKYLCYTNPQFLAECQSILSIPAKKVEIKPLEFLSAEGVHAILDEIDIKTKTGFRDYTMITIMFSMGVRVSELIGIQVRHISLLSPHTILVKGKGSKSRFLSIPTPTYKILKKYLDQEGFLKDDSKQNEWIFLNHSGNKFTRQGINFVLKKYADLARKKSPELIPAHVTAHTLRHSAAMELLKNGVDLVYIRDILGHSSVKTTEIYAKADEKVKREAIEKASEKTFPEEVAVWEQDESIMEWLLSLNK